jgi:hypothetical protein
MATNYWRFEARNQAELDAMISKYVVSGFYIANRTPTMVTLVRRKQFSIVALVIGLVLCVLPLLFYLVIYMLERDRVVEISLVPDPQIGVRSDDGRYWWDGTAWQPMAAALPVPTSETSAAPEVS